MNKTILGSLILVLLFSGCVGLNLPFNIPFLTPTGPNVTKLGPDVITIQSINVIPQTSIRPDDEFSVYYEVKNQDENEMIKSISYVLYDTGLCVWKSASPGSTSSKVYTWPDGFAPSETKLVEWNFKAPSKEQIAGLPIKCPIKFKVNYTYNARSQIDIVVIDAERLEELQRSGKDVTYTPSLSIGRGPVKIYFDFGNTLPVRNNSNISVYIKVKDEGAGLYSEIPKGGLSINISAVNGVSFQKVDCINDYFSCPTTSSCSNSVKAIPLIKKQTFELRCDLWTPLTINMEQTFYISATISNYNYDVLGEASVEVKP